MPVEVGRREELLAAIRGYGDARADVAYGRATRKAIDLAWDRMLVAADIPPLDQRDLLAARTADDRLREAVVGLRHVAGFPEYVIRADVLALLADRAEPVDVKPELQAWFHESEEICEHDDPPWPCEIMADALLRAFTVEPRLTQLPDGTVTFEGRHFHRLTLAARLAEAPGR